MASVIATGCDGASAEGPKSEFDEVETPNLLSTQIRGLWAESLQGCKDEYDTSRMKIGANWISFHESYGLLQISTPAGIPDLDQSLAASFIMAGEGGTWQNEFIFGWREAKQNELFLIEPKSAEDTSRERRRFRYVRCK